MSGPKCAIYDVEAGRNDLLRKARLEQARQAARSSAAQLNRALDSSRNTGTLLGIQVDIAGSMPRTPSEADASLEALEQYVAAVQSMLTRITAAIDRAEALHQLQSMSRVSAPLSQVKDWSDDLVRRKASMRSPVVPRGVVTAIEVEDILGKQLARLEGGLSEAEVAKLLGLAEAIRSTVERPRLESLETELRLTLQRANDRSRARQRDSVECTLMLAELRGLEATDVAAVRGELARVVDGQQELTPSLRTRVSSVRQDGERRMNERYVGQVMKEELARLGYIVGDGFTTVFCEGGSAIVAGHNGDGYGVEFEVNPDKGLADLAVVRVDGPGSPGVAREVLDTEAEVRWCHDFGTLQANLKTRGVKSRMVKMLPPGTRPVKSVRANAAAQTRRSTRPKSQSI